LSAPIAVPKSPMAPISSASSDTLKRSVANRRHHRSARTASAINASRFQRWPVSGVNAMAVTIAASDSSAAANSTRRSPTSPCTPVSRRHMSRRHLE
jgi:hypothetical protein